MQMMTVTEFAREMRVSHPAVSKAIRVGRVPVYDVSGLPVSADYAGRKFVKPEEAELAFRRNRARVNDDQIADFDAIASEFNADRHGDADAAGPLPSGLAAAKARREDLQSQILEIRLAQERGELVSREAAITTFEEMGRLHAEKLTSLEHCAEELVALANKGGAVAVSTWLRAKTTELCNSMANDLQRIDDLSESRFSDQ